MSKKVRHKLQDLVTHPRYGSDIRPSGLNISPDVVVNSFWRYSTETIFPETAIRADLAKQNYSTVPRTYYVDILKQCLDCARKYIFFAEEQKYWYEELRFYVDSDCIRCPECRQNHQESRKRFKSYSEKISEDSLSDDSLADLVADAVFLWESGELKNHHNLKRLKNRANQQIPDRPITEAINKLVDSLPNE